MKQSTRTASVSADSKELHMAVQSAAKSLVPVTQEEGHLTYHFSPGLQIGDTVYVSGQMGTGEDGMPLADPEAQYVAAFENVKEVLTLAGCGLEDIVDLMTFHSSFDSLELFIEIKDRYITGPIFPAWTAVGANLALAGALIEIKCTAIVKDAGKAG